MSDLIDRQAAIEWCLEGLNNMPSVQPEIIRCKDCKYFEADIMGNPFGVCCHDGWVDRQYSIGFSVSEDGYCYRGADMRGEE